MQLIVGQRCISHAEPALGLGIVIEVEYRRVTISFPAAEETRTYSSDSAPLTRVEYAAGEQITTAEGESFTVMEKDSFDGIITYTVVDSEGVEKDICEVRLAANVRLTTPKHRLTSGQTARLATYQMRIEALLQKSRTNSLKINGLLGSRVNLIPHQLYVASEVAKRHAPRVLLSDEVGLGKTIEAGMIIHNQLLNEMVKRVLIIVPENLLHQWLVEMLRKFNLTFSIFDRNRLQEIGEDINPFEEEQLILCSSDFVTDEDNRHIRDLIISCDWDMLVVDEVHQVQLHSNNSDSDSFSFIKKLSEKAAGLILLSATPEQSGIENHFARLALLDPDKFCNLEEFIKSEKRYSELSDILQKLDETDNISEETLAVIEKVFTIPESAKENKERLINSLVDQHGTGRILFRNSRSIHTDFPQRVIKSYPLELPDIYLSDIVDETEINGLYPESTADIDWLENDPRVEWLQQLCKENKNEKILVICHLPQTAAELDRYLNLYAGIRSTSFYEGLSIIERDRSAAYFQDSENGAQIMVCSEIGSEGRNFQFARHLVLFDLPFNPDLIEQRIGRLDRIGQIGDINIYTPYICETVQEISYSWHDAIGTFQSKSSENYLVYEKFAEQLEHIDVDNKTKLDLLLKEATAMAQENREQLSKGRDILLEHNSCNKEKAEKLVNLVKQEDECNNLQLFMEKVFAKYNIDEEVISENIYFIRVGENSGNNTPFVLPPKGMQITYDRDTASQRDDVEFITREHPIVIETIDNLINSETGNSTVCSTRIKNLPQGSLLLESFFSMEAIAPRKYQLHRFLPSEPLRIVIDMKGRELTELLDYDKLNSICQPVAKKISSVAVQKVKAEIEEMVKASQKIAEKQLPHIAANAKAMAEKHIKNDIDRLKNLQEINNLVRESEIEFYEEMLAESLKNLENTTATLQALRLVVNM
ncbi:MAG: RNA polymerase-associated protein RapA [Gammaproteobacteria bacterium]|nr:MAG: RNA polymerase-associated protein RapA [Gammaproteobacteria bacterium]